MELVTRRVEVSENENAVVVRGCSCYKDIVGSRVACMQSSLPVVESGGGALLVVVPRSCSARMTATRPTPHTPCPEPPQCPASRK